MLQFIYGDRLDARARLARGMFRDRAAQFRDRLGWKVSVDSDGAERDEYDALNPLYVIARDDDGGHAGSMRFLPTTGPTMLHDHFAALVPDLALQSPLIWECTRFCVAPGVASSRKVTARLLAAAAVMGEAFSLVASVAVFDDRMIRVYRALGWAPEVLASGMDPSGRVHVGLWHFGHEATATMCARAGVDAGVIRAKLAADLARPAVPA